MEVAVPARPGSLDRALRPFADVRAGEALTAVLFSTSLFVGLFAYYVLKTVREPLVLATGGAELRSYATGVQALVLAGAVPLYGRLAARLDRRTLVLGTSLFFLGCLELFSIAAWLEVPYVGFAFFVWLGVYVLTSVAQLWSLANDVYAEARGTRLFPLVALGAPLGSALGAYAAAHLFAGRGAEGIQSLLQLAAGLLLGQLAILWLLLRRPEAEERAAPPMRASSGFSVVLASPALRTLALLVVVLNLVNTTGEYLLARAIVGEADAALATALASGASIVDEAAFRADFIRTTYGEFYVAVNVASVLLQAFVASRVVALAGVRGTLMVLPIVALGTYALAAVGVGFVALRAIKAVENATDYSVQNTAKALVWLPHGREAKYAGKQVIDGFFVRVGDVLSALAVFGAVELSGLHGGALAAANVALAAVAIGLAWRAGRPKTNAEGDAASPASAAAA